MKEGGQGSRGEKENAFSVSLFVFLSLAPLLLCSPSVVPSPPRLFRGKVGMGGKFE